MARTVTNAADWRFAVIGEHASGNTRKMIFMTVLIFKKKTGNSEGWSSL
jgi:hypothetical protein